ncbi:Enoyl-CoA hydratase [Balamuthia mandrillaris]
MKKAVLYEVKGRVAHITLNRPERLNAINNDLRIQLQESVAQANRDDRVHVIVLSGAGRAFCSGYDLRIFAEGKGEYDAVQQTMPWDPIVDYQMMDQFTQSFLSLWRSYKPVICKIQGYAVAGGSDIALCCDLVVMAEDAKIGYPPARVWGCPTTFMWVYRVGAEKAKRMLLTGDLINGKEAEKMGLVSAAVPASELDATVEKLAQRISSVPKNQLIMQKLVINSAYENMGMRTTQTMATLMDGIARHSPEGVGFKERAEQVGFKQAVIERDSGRPITFMAKTKANL